MRNFLSHKNNYKETKRNQKKFDTNFNSLKFFQRSFIQEPTLDLK